jgi:hypothetical protein
MIPAPIFSMKNVVRLAIQNREEDSNKINENEQSSSSVFFKSSNELFLCIILTDEGIKWDNITQRAAV